MLNSCLGLDSELLWQLDPSRHAGAEETYKNYTHWVEAGDARVGFSHDSISPCFRNGCGQHELLQELVEDPTYAQTLARKGKQACISTFLVAEVDGRAGFTCQDSVVGACASSACALAPRGVHLIQLLDAEGQMAKRCTHEKEKEKREKKINS